MKDERLLQLVEKLQHNVASHLQDVHQLLWRQAGNEPVPSVRATALPTVRKSRCFAAISAPLPPTSTQAASSGETAASPGEPQKTAADDAQTEEGAEADQDAGPSATTPPPSQCIAEGIELESTVMEETEEKEPVDDTMVGPLPRWETVDSMDQDKSWWRALPKPPSWFRRRDKAGVPARSRKLREELRCLVTRQERKRKMHVGVFVEHLPSGERISINGSEAFPLASVAKVPILVAAARQLQEAEADPKGPRLTTRLPVTDDVKCIGSGELHERASGLTATLGECMELSCVISDNTAADLVLKQVTLSRVQELLRERGLNKTDICLSQRQAFLIAMGMTPSFRELSAIQIAQRWQHMTVAQRAAIISEAEQANTTLSVKKFLGAERLAEANYKRAGRLARKDSMAVAAAVDNTGSPEDMAKLLKDLAAGQLLNPKWTRHCMGILLRQQYGKRRLPRGLPRDTRVYHKTGTIMGVCNDVGIIEVGSPDNLVVVAAMVSGIMKNQYDREAEAVIAQVGRLAYKAFKPTSVKEGHTKQQRPKIAAET